MTQAHFWARFRSVPAKVVVRVPLLVDVISAAVVVVVIDSPTALFTVPITTTTTITTTIANVSRMTQALFGVRFRSVPAKVAVRVPLLVVVISEALIAVEIDTPAERQSTVSITTTTTITTTITSVTPGPKLSLRTAHG